MSNVQETPDIQGVMVMTFLLMATTTTILVALFSFNCSLTNKEASNRGSLFGVFSTRSFERRCLQT